MSITPLDANDLKSHMAKTEKNIRCQVTITNASPPEWGVTIGQTGVKFFYRDGTDYTDGPRTMSIESGESAAFVSHDGSRCVFGVFVAARIHKTDQKPEIMIYQHQVDKEDECLLHLPLTLGPRSSVSVDTLNNAITSGYLKLEVAL